MVAAAQPKRGTRRGRRWLHQVALYASLGTACVVTIFPIYWMVVSTIQPTAYTLQFPPPLWPKHIDLAPVAVLFQDFPLMSWIVNSVLLAGIATALSMLLTIGGAYALSSTNWRGQNLFGFLLLLTQMLPETLLLIPIYIIYRHLDILENLPALALIHVAFVLPISIWILKNVFDSIPREIREAAVVDGARSMAVLWEIILPLSGPGLAAVGVITFFYSWNEFLFAGTFITHHAITPAPVGLSTLISQLDTPVQRLMAAGLIFSVWPVLFYMFVQRHILSGLTAGAVKG